MINMNIFQRVPIVMWRSVFENTRYMIGVLLRPIHIITGKLTSEYCIAAYLFSKQVCRLRRKSGLLFVALYLKQCSVVLMKYYGEGSFPPALLKPQVSLTRSGLPRIIPSFHRKVIRRRDSRADICVKIYLSWFTLARIVLLSAKVTRSTFKSIVEGYTDTAKVTQFITDQFLYMYMVIDRYLPDLHLMPLYQGIKWVPTWKSVPNSPRYRIKRKMSLYSSIVEEMIVFDDILNFFISPSSIYPAASLTKLSLPRIEYSIPTNSYNVAMNLGQALQFSRTMSAALADNLQDSFVWKLRLSRLAPCYVARVASVMAGAGKRRLFIIGNYGVQRVLKPYHDWCMSVLKILPGDGTFNQLKPLDRVKGCPYVASFDLSSATDRWPRHYMSIVLCICFGLDKAITIGTGCLGSLGVTICPPLTNKTCKIANTVGTLLGYYCAWPLFALSHHILIWCAADNVYPDEIFSAYGVLGDDVVIGDRKVAEEYRRMVNALGVEISDAKSLSSNTGAFEFAKKFYVRRGRVDCSPVSLKTCLLSRTMVGLANIKRTYNIQSMKCMFRLAGAGYRVMSRLQNPKGRWARLPIYLSYNPGFTELAFEWWLSGFKNPLNPYLKGVLVLWLLERSRPREIKLPSEGDLSQQEDPELVLESCEYTITREWLLKWLSALSWYYTRCAKGWDRLTSLLDMPVVEVSWYRREVDPTVHRFGCVWRLYNMVNGGVTVYPLPLCCLVRSKEQLWFPVLWVCVIN